MARGVYKVPPVDQRGAEEVSTMCESEGPSFVMDGVGKMTQLPLAGTASENCMRRGILRDSLVSVGQ